MWSPANDNESVLQKNFLDSVNQKMKLGAIALLEFPIGYIDEMSAEMERSGRKTAGRIIKSFISSDGGEVTKSFEITTLMPLFDRLKDSRLKVLNIGDSDDEIIMPLVYVTSSGQKRAFVVVQKVGEPAYSIDQILLSGASAVGAYDARGSTSTVQ